MQTEARRPRSYQRAPSAPGTLFNTTIFDIQLALLTTRDPSIALETPRLASCIRLGHIPRSSYAHHIGTQASLRVLRLKITFFEGHSPFWFIRGTLLSGRTLLGSTPTKQPHMSVPAWRIEHSVSPVLLGCPAFVSKPNHTQ